VIIAKLDTIEVPCPFESLKGPIEQLHLNQTGWPVDVTGRKMLLDTFKAHLQTCINPIIAAQQYLARSTPGKKLWVALNCSHQIKHCLRRVRYKGLTFNTGHGLLA
jgi:hypothetical protein